MATAAITPGEDCLVFVGSYTDFDILAHLPKNDQLGAGVYCFRFSKGELHPLSVIPSLNPAVLSLHPSAKQTLYALSEGIKEDGLITRVKYAYAADEDKLRVIGPNEETPTKGKSLCYFRVDPVSLRYGIAVNYWNGSIDVFRMREQDGSVLSHVRHIEHLDICRSLRSASAAADGNSAPRRQVRDRVDHWQNRQCGPHAHSVHFHKEWVFVPDLGENGIFQYRWRPDKGQLLEFEAVLHLHEGAGPRHCVFDREKRACFVSNELDSTITVLRIDEDEPDEVRCRLKAIQTIDTAASRQTEQDVNRKNYVAEIGMSADGRFVYVSNRGLDTLAIFEAAEDGKLTPVDYVSTFGKTPRHFAISPDGGWLIGANQDSNNLVVFRRDAKGGGLKMHKRYDAEVKAPNFVLFAPLGEVLKDDEAEQAGQKKGERAEWLQMAMAVLFVAVLCGLLAAF